MRRLLISAALLSGVSLASAQDVDGYYSARGALADIHKDERDGPWPTGKGLDPLCGCEADALRLRISDPLKCPPLRESQDDTDADLVAVRIVDPKSAAKQLACGRAGNRWCVDPKTGLQMRGAACCDRDDEYAKVLRDPHLSVLMPRIVARRLEGLTPSLVPPPKAKADICGVQIDRTGGSFSLPNYMAGFAARAWLHGALVHKIEPPTTMGEIARIALAQPPIAYEISVSKVARRTMLNVHRGVEAQLDRLAPLNMSRR